MKELTSPVVVTAIRLLANKTGVSDWLEDKAVRFGSFCEWCNDVTGYYP